MKKCSTFVYGATFWGIGFAAASSDVLIADPGINPGHEFADTFCTKVCRRERLQTEIARSFYTALQKHNAVEDGRLHPAALVPLLSAFVLEHKINIQLDTVLLDKRSLCIMSGVSKKNISAGRFIDTLTPPGTVRGKYFNAILHGVEDAVLPSEYLNSGYTDEPSLSAGRFPSEAVLHIPVSRDADYIEAREKLEKFWRNRPSCLSQWRVAVLAPEFYEFVDTPQYGDIFFSKGYSDPLTAMDSGVMEALK